jgi:hypothetical protein
LDRRWRERPNITVESDQTRDEVSGILAGWALQPVGLELYVWTVQPGVSRERMEGWINGNTLISAANEWCASQGATFRVALSA